MADKRHIDQATGTETVGHEWDGIEELNTPLPRWWLITFYITIIWSVAYVIAYPAWPMISGYTKGMLGWSSRGELHKELAEQDKLRAPILAAIGNTPITELPGNEKLMHAAVEGGRAAFKVHCVQCHGSGAAGSPGYPNLNDDDWLWGGDLATIEQTIAHGIRNPDHDQTRISQMPAFGRDGLLTAAQIDDVVAHVRTISKQQPASAASARGAQLFADNCAVCHGADGTGNRTLGAPNLTDGIWLYGGSADAVRTTVHNSRAGVMPRWEERLGPVQVKMLAAYVHSLGGGENAPAMAAEAAGDTADNAATAQ